MMNPSRKFRAWRNERFLQKDSLNSKPVAMIKEKENIYRFVWADEKPKLEA